MPEQAACSGQPRLADRGGTTIRIRARIYACRKSCKINPPLGADFETQTCATDCQGGFRHLSRERFREVLATNL